MYKSEFFTDIKDDTIDQDRAFIENMVVDRLTNILTSDENNIVRDNVNLSIARRVLNMIKYGDTNIS